MSVVEQDRRIYEMDDHRVGRYITQVIYWILRNLALRTRVETLGSASKMLLKSRWRSHESGVKPEPLALDSPIQTISLLSICYKPAFLW